MFWSGFESNIAILLNLSLHDVFLEEIPHFLTKEYFLLDFDMVSEGMTLLYFLSGLQSSPMKHLIVPNEGSHHGLKNPSIEH